MTPQELKNSILQFAIQGKLVEQRPEEGTAEELCQQIQEEMRRLAKEKRIKKEMPLPEITEDEIPFEIPESWKWIRFGEMSQFFDGEKMHGVSYPYLDAKFLRGKSDPTFATSGKFVRSGTKVILVDGENSGEVFSVPQDGYMGSTFKVLFYSSSLFEPYVSYFMLYHRRDYRNNKKGSAIPHLNRVLFFNMPIPIPPLAEQKRLVAKIEELLPYIDRYEQAWNRLEKFNKRFPIDMQKSILQLAIQGRLVEHRPEEGTAEELYQQIQAEKRRLIREGKIKKEKPLPEIAEDEVPFEIPDSWKWVRLGEAAYFQGGYAYKSISYVSESTNQIIRLGNVKQGYLFSEAKPVYIPDNIAAETECYKIQVNDILVTMTGTRKKKDYFYATKICKEDLLNRNLFLNQRVGCFRAIDGLMPEYLLKVMQCETIRDLILKKETGTANQGNLGSEDMKMYVYVPLPPIAEQKRIVAKLEELLPLCERLKCGINVTTERI